MTTKTKKYVLYHLDKDGQGSAYCAWKKFGKSAKYLPVNYGQPMPQMDDGSEVYIVDFSYSGPALMDLAERMEKVVVLDHHKTAEAGLYGVAHPRLAIRFNSAWAGVGITWQHFFPSEKLPVMLAHIQDRDLWQFALPGTAEVHEFLCSYSYSPELWDFFVNMPIDEIIKEGKAILRAREEAVRNIARNAYRIEFDGHPIAKVNTSVYQSEVCHYLLENEEGVTFVMAYSESEEGTWIHSLRSKGEFDVSEIAKAHGGGGHKNAAGFEVKGTQK